MELSKQALLNGIFNWKEKLYHKLTPEEVQLFKNTQLFDKMHAEVFDKMVHDIRLIKYAPGELIIREGTLGDALFIIAEGAVRVFTLDSNRAKISLARLNKGSYFGEQALLGRAYRTRNANIEAITETTLIQVKEKYFKEILQADTYLESRLAKTGYEQAINSLRESTGFYFNLETFFSELKNPTIVELTQDDLIFNVGDKPDNVYIVLQGEVKLQIPHKHDNLFSNLILHKGHLFGELGVLHNKPRAATAIANSSVRLLSIKGDDFKQYAHESPELQQILASLQQVYRLPMDGFVEQYFGKAKELGRTITNIYKMSDGRFVISANFINENIFTMYTVPHVVEKKYSYARGAYQIELEIDANRIRGIKASGIWEELPAICHLLLANTVVDDAALTEFTRSGQLGMSTQPAANKNEIICDCMSVTRHTLQELIDSGVRDLPTLSKTTGACTSCRGCTVRIYEMLGENPWLTSVIRKTESHNAYITSYHVTPTLSQFKAFKPGQYVIIQIKTGDNWIERPYTISGIDTDGSLRITIKTETNGLFTQWLNKHMRDEGIEINTMQPQGDFVLNIADETQPVVCFAGGIGITPFITFAKSLSDAKNKKRLHIVYFASTSGDFVFKNEFDEVVRGQDCISVAYRATKEQGSLSEDEIVKVVREMGEPDVYICGAEGFVKKVQMGLVNAGYDVTKIHVEQFVHAGLH